MLHPRITKNMLAVARRKVKSTIQKLKEVRCGTSSNIKLKNRSVAQLQDSQKKINEINSCLFAIVKTSKRLLKLQRRNNEHFNTQFEIFYRNYTSGTGTLSN